MSLRHAAALALVGWYLMVPPYEGRISDPASVVVNDRAAISKWEISDSFDSANDCADQRMRSQSAASKYPDSMLRAPKTSHQLTVARFMFATCIATDDPRLKEK